MTKLELYQFPECPYCDKVLRVINELKVDVTLHNTRTDSKAREALVKLNGISQVPCLLINGKPMLESDDIVQWLKSNYAAKNS